MHFKKLLLTISLLSTHAANAYEFDIVKNLGNQNKMDASIQIGATSYHFNKKDHKYLNEANPSIGVELWDISVVYVNKNSWNTRSLYVTYSPEIVERDFFVLSGQFGFATGYSNNQYIRKTNGARYQNDMLMFFGLTPIIGLTGKISISKQTNINLSITPDAAGISTEFKF